MRNGLDVGGLSELVHEVQDKPEEAMVTFLTTGAPRCDGLEVTLHTATIGTTRMARDFALSLQPYDGAVPERMTPEECAMAALGACVLITHMYGYSTRGVSLTAMSARVDAGVRIAAASTSRSFRDIRYVIDVDCDDTIATEHLVGILKFVTSFSPNHRAYLDVGDIDVAVRARRSSGATEELVLRPDDLPAPSPAGEGSGEDATVPVGALLEWEYRTQTVPTVWCGNDGELRHVDPGFAVDQPKQMIGIDKGPNPQEMMLAAACGDLADRLDASVRGRGQLDIRGAANVRKESPARFHALRFDVELTSDAPMTEVRAAVLDAVAGSAILTALRVPQQIAVTLRRRGQTVFEFDSTFQYAVDFLAEMAEQEQAGQP